MKTPSENHGTTDEKTLAEQLAVLDAAFVGHAEVLSSLNSSTGALDPHVQRLTSLHLIAAASNDKAQRQEILKGCEDRKTQLLEFAGKWIDIARAS